jgi:Fic family protein
MRAFLQDKNLARLLTPERSAMLGAIHEYKGKQDFFLGAKPDTLEALLEIAKIQSTDASNRIEGIFTSDARLRELVAEKTTPRNRNEREILGYRDVLALIHESHDAIPVSPSVILQLHRDLYRHLPAGIGGVWKASDNVIAQTDASGARSVRFAPVSAFETPIAMDALCTAFRAAEDGRRHDPLLVSALFVLDFLCIHPFSDGNGRMSRLLTLLLLYRAGYVVGKYVSLEAMIERSKESYYDALQASSRGWHEERNDPAPFLDYFLQIVLGGYREFESRVEKLIANPATKAVRIRAVFEERVGRIRKRDILRLCPDISEAMVEKTLKALLDAGYIRKLGAGPATAYAKTAP